MSTIIKKKARMYINVFCKYTFVKNNWPWRKGESVDKKIEGKRRKPIHWTKSLTPQDGDK